jgi:hypothetical protein
MAIILSIGIIFCLQKRWSSHEIANMKTADASLETREDKRLFAKKSKKYEPAGAVSLLLGDDCLENL